MVYQAGRKLRQLSQRLYKQLAPTSGIGRDMALFRLSRALPGAPRNVARQIPERMDRLVGWVINQRIGDKGFTSLSLDKRECRVDRHMPLIGGGADDKTLGLALFDCEIRQGNSGSAFYLPNDTQNIQVLVNTLWNWNKDDGSASKRFKNLFLERPSFMNREYAMGERLHCADVPFYPAPAEYCHFMDLENTTGERLREAVRSQAEKWFNSRPQTYGGFEWTLEAIEGEFNYGAVGATPGIVLVPTPYCVAGPQSDVEMSALFLRPGLMPDGRGEVRTVGVRNGQFRSLAVVRDEYVFSALWTWAVSAPSFTPSTPSREIYEQSFRSRLNKKLARCGSNSRNEARETTVKRINASLRLTNPLAPRTAAD